MVALRVRPALSLRAGHAEQVAAAVTWGEAGRVRDGVEWGESPSSPIEDDDDVLELGRVSGATACGHPVSSRRRRTLLLARLAAAAVVAGGLATYITVRSSRTDRPAPHPVIAATTPSVNESPDEAALAMIQALAHQTEPLTDISRPVSTAGACTVVEPGHSPQRAIITAVRRTLPTFTTRDVARTLDQYTAMCAIEVRARDANGSVLVLDIVAPQSDAVRRPTPHLSVASRLDGTAVATSATVVTRTGWTIVIGSSGPVADQPDSGTLLRLAQDPALLW